MGQDHEYDSPEERYYDKLDDRAEERPWLETLIIYGAIGIAIVILVGVVLVRPRFTPATAPTGAAVAEPNASSNVTSTPPPPSTKVPGTAITAFVSKHKGTLFLIMVLGGVVYYLFNREQERIANIPKIITLEEAQEKALEVLSDEELENVILKPMKRNRKDLMVYRFLFAEELIEGFNYHYPTGTKKRDRFYYQVSIDYYGNLDCFEESSKKLKSMEWINEKGDRASLAATERWRRLIERNIQGPMDSREWEERARLLNSRGGWRGDPNMPIGARRKSSYRRPTSYRPRNVHYGGEAP